MRFTNSRRDSRDEAKGKRQKAKGKRQKAKGKRQKAKKFRRSTNSAEFQEKYVLLPFAFCLVPNAL
jgi:hypothetical protein